jgi:thiamine monophosphate synthase
MRLLAITPPASVAPRIDPAVVDVWIRGGALELGIAVLLREPEAGIEATLEDPRLFELRAALAERGIPTLLSVSGDALDERGIATLHAARPALAGVQLRGDPSLAVTCQVRAALRSMLIGRSCHAVTPDPAEHPVDYTCLAPVFAPNTEQRGRSKQAIGLAALARWTAAVPRVFALGGVVPSTAAACLAAGATGLAGISLFFGQSAAAQQNVAALRQAFEARARPHDHAPQARQRR